METTEEAKKALKKHDKSNRKQIIVECEGPCGEKMTVGKPKILTKARYMCLNCYEVDKAIREVRDKKRCGTD